MYRADTDHRPQRVTEESDEVLLTGQASLPPGGGEQHILREEIMELTRESERETRGLSAFGAKCEERRGATTSTAYAVEGKDTGPGNVGHQPDQEKMEIRGGIRTRNLLPRIDISTVDIRRVDLIGRTITSMNLANAVEATMGKPTSATNSEAPQLWSLVIRQCQLSSLIPVAGLLHHLDGLMGLRVHEVAGLALAGVDRVLADARCLSTLTISMCGLSSLPRLQSGSIEILDLSDNKLESARGLEMLFRLKELNLAGNNISSLTDVRPLISLGAGCLRELSLDENPVKNISRYRESVAIMLPSIQLLDGVAIARPWRAGKTTDITTGGNRGCTALECTTPPRVRDRVDRVARPVDGYFSDGGGRAPRRAGQGNSRCSRKSRAELEDVGEEHGFVRGLAGLGLIWGGIPPLRTSRSLCSSPVRARTPRGRGNGDAVCASTWDGDFGELERSRGIGRSATRSPKRGRPPSPARCRQMEADDARSRPRPKPKPRAHWDTRFRNHHLQELAARDFAKKRTARLSRHTQRATMDRLAQPVRRCNETGGEGEASLAGDMDMQAWNALFTEAILIQSPGLVDRPTALKQPDGQWRGVVSTSSTGEREAIPTASKTWSLQVPAPSAVAQYTSVNAVDGAKAVTNVADATDANVNNDVNDVNDVSTVPPPGRDPEHSIQGISPRPTDALPSTSLDNLTTPVSRLQEDRVSQSPPSQPATSSPPRATLVLPDAMTPDDHADVSRAAGSHDVGHSSFNTPGAPLGDGQRLCACGGQILATRSGMSSTKSRSEGACRDGVSPRENRQSESRPGGARGVDSLAVRTRTRTRTPRVLKTSRDFAQTIRRVFKVDLNEDEAKALYRQLDSDRDGALGAEDLLRGAPTIASFLSPTQSIKPDGSRRQGPQNTACAGHAWNRNAKLENDYRKREDRRGDGRSSTRRLTRQDLHHQREALMDNDPMPRRISVSGEEGIRLHTPTRSFFGDGVPRRLEDWRIPQDEDIRPNCELRHGAARGQKLDEQQPLGQIWT